MVASGRMWGSRPLPGDTVALVPVRRGSKGLPGKNERLLAGVPLHARAVAQGLRTAARCVLSTDIPALLSAPQDERCCVLARPPALAADDASMDGVIAHVIDALDLRRHVIVLLQATSPLRVDADVEAALALHRAGGFELVMSTTRADASVLKWGTLEDGRYVPVSDPAYCFRNRQSLPAVFRPNGAVYVFTAEDFLRNGGLATDRIGAIAMPPERSVDIDSEADFARAEALLSTAREG